MSKFDVEELDWPAKSADLNPTALGLIKNMQEGNLAKLKLLLIVHKCV